MDGDEKYFEDSGIFLKICTIVSLRVNICIGTPTTTVVCRYIVLGMHTNLYNKCFVNGEKYKCWANTK